MLVQIKLSKMLLIFCTALILSGCVVSTVVGVTSAVVGATTTVVGGAVDVVDAVTPDIIDDDDEDDNKNDQNNDNNNYLDSKKLTEKVPLVQQKY